MKISKYIFNFKTLLVFIASVLMISCSNDDGENPTYDTTPGQAVLVLPLNNQQCEVGEVTDDKAVVAFSWEASTDTEKYNLEIVNLVTEDVTLNIGLPTNSTNVTLLRGYPYSWKVTSRNSGDTVTESEVWKFYLAGDGESNTVPFPATLLSPTSGATVTPTDGKVTLEWESSDSDGDEVTFTVFADTVDGNQDVPEAWQNIAENSLDVSVAPGTIYYWHIETSDGINTSISATHTFRTAE
jgi:hypothetical protein